MDDQWLGDNPAHGHPRVQGGIRVLEDHLHPPAIGQLLGPRAHAKGLAVDPDFACRGLDQADQHAAERGLAATALGDQAQGLAMGELERHAVYRDHLLLGEA